MQDMVIKGTGNSRFLKSVENFLDLFPNYEAFAAAFAAGILPVDFNGINPDGITQMGTPYAKSAVLTDETAALFGLGETAVPDDVFRKIDSGFSKIATGSYVGTGTSGPTNACRVEVGFKPLVLIVFVKTHMSRMMVSCRPWTAYADIDITSTTNSAHCEWGDDFVSWYHDSGVADSVNDQYNASNKEYQYIVFG